ncbi:hypothetical protein KDH_22730 [Dictyobacter sp. S3.2.2.5]|uniref:DUF304 domain-containing protein n=1 Tax=Dictyobacter halimunensis TaxID=3026934 RepID=A0ABQ6FMG4_9CHLR|nr:hypothetical protein KDH_22730 [Dictyobacter sp. S3.2.2.5]
MSDGYSSQQRQAIKRHDPIWRSLRIERIVSIILGFMCAGYIVFDIHVYREIAQNNPIGLIVFCILLLRLIFKQVWQERHWLRIGERRLYALHNDVSVGGQIAKQTATQPVDLPLVVALDWRRDVLIIIGVVLATFAVAIVVTEILWPGTSNQNVFIIIVFSTIILFTVVWLLASWAYQAYFLRQRIEVSEEGITTRFRGQEYSIRWQDAHIFAQYRSGVMAQSRQIFELCNEQVIVRWSQHEFLGNFLLKTVSNVSDQHDYNWLIGRVNALVSEHTRLPLLRLDNTSPIKLNRQVRESLHTLSYESADTTPPLAQDDPLVQRIQWSGQSGLVVLIGIGISLLMVIYGVLSLTHSLFMPALPGFGNAFWLVIGILLFIMLVLSAVILLASQRYWQHLNCQRQRAIQQPDAFLAQSQPIHIVEPPQPVSLIIRPRAYRLFIMFFIEGFFLGSLLNNSLFNAIIHQRLALSGLISPFIFALSLGIFMTPFIQRSTQQRIEVNAQGISTRLNMIDSHINWQDARLFTRYRILQLFSKPPRSQYYEIASQQTVVRWLANRSRVATVTTQPKMNQQQYELWLRDLSSYITQRTNLPLVDLDGTPMSPEEK